MRTTFKSPIKLQHGDVSLRLIEQSDKKTWEEIRSRNQDWLVPWDSTNPAGDSTNVGFRVYVRRLRAGFREQSVVPLVIEHNGRVVGQITLGNVVWGSLRQGYVGYWIDSRVAGRGIVPTAVALILDYAFQDCELHRVEISIRPENVASLRVVEKLGLKSEGIRRKYLHIAGDWRDHYAYVAIAEELPAEGFVASQPFVH